MGYIARSTTKKTPQQLQGNPNLLVEPEGGEHQSHQCSQRLDHAVLKRPKLGEAEKVSPVGDRPLDDQSERPRVLGRRAALQNVDNLRRNRHRFRRFENEANASDR